jgi:ABC-type amino acid transport system permease subunit
MLPFYHRQHDAKLLLLTVPACALLWAGGGWTGRLALLINTAGFVVTADFPWVIFFALANSLHLTILSSKQIFYAAHVMPAPLILLTMSVFYLWVYVRSASGEPGSGSGQPVGSASVASEDASS